MRLGYHLVVRDEPKSPAAEAIRSLRTNLQFASIERKLQTVMITSAAPAEGKTALAGNLAASLAMSGSKTIVVGADLRKPSIHEVFGLRQSPGVTNVLVGTASVDDVLQDADVPNLKVLASGPIPPNPAELIGSKAMEQLVEELRERADMVIFDATPVLAVTDATLLSRAMDGVLVVVAMKMTPREIVRRACEELRQAKANILGIVANRISMTKRTDYYYYAYYADPKAEKVDVSKVSRSSRYADRGVISRLLKRAISKG